MELKLFHRTQRDLACAVNFTIDEYWASKIPEQQMIDTIKSLHEHNPDKFMKEYGFTKIIQQQCGKRRLEVVRKILKIEN